jgi:ATP synthase protein I
VSGESRVAGNALLWGALAAVPGVGLAAALRGGDGAISAAVGIALVLANVALSAIFSVAAGKLTAAGPALVAMPSFTVRMAAIFFGLAALRNRSFIDEPVLAVTFVAALTLVLWREALTFKRTPWLALTFGPKEQS